MQTFILTASPSQLCRQPVPGPRSAPSPPSHIVTKLSSLLAASTPGMPAPAPWDSCSCCVSKWQLRRAPACLAWGPWCHIDRNLGIQPERLVPFADLPSPGCQPSCPLQLSSHMALLVPTTAGIPGQAPGAGLSPSTAIPVAVTQADATASMPARTRGACPRCRLTCCLRWQPRITVPGWDAALAQPSPMPSATLCLREPTAAPLALGSHPRAAVPAGGGFGDTGSPINSAAPYGTGGATVPRQSPVASFPPASPAPEPPCPPSRVLRVPSPHGPSSTRRAGGEGGSGKGTRAGDTRWSHTRLEPKRGCAWWPCSPEGLGSTDPEQFYLPAREEERRSLRAGGRGCLHPQLLLLILCPVLKTALSAASPRKVTGFRFLFFPWKPSNRSWPHYCSFLGLFFFQQG